ncbi:MAG TPA: phage tail protein [Verrucomicrobiae bacterium]
MHAGWIHSAEGGHAYADVVTEKQGPDGIVHKHLAGVKYEDIAITCGAGMSKAFFEWIQSTLQHKFERKDGAIVATDFNFNSMTVLKFSQALISEIGFPALDGSSKEAAKLTLKFSPELTEYKHTVGAPIIDDPSDLKQKKWLVSNFRFKIDGLDESSNRVGKIEAITIKQKVVENPVGENRDFDTTTSLDFSNLKITLPEHNAEDLFGWFEDFVIKGNDTQDKERTGTLEYLTPDLKTTLFALDFHQVGIFKLTPDDFTPDNSDKLRKVSAEMYVEEIKFRSPLLPPPNGD